MRSQRDGGCVASDDRQSYSPDQRWSRGPNVAWLGRVVNVPVRRSSLEAGAAEDVYRWRIDLSGSLVEGVAV
jgi:hypothetical protein